MEFLRSTGVRARSIKPLERGRRVCGRRGRLCQFNRGRNDVKVCRGCARSPGDERHGLKRGLLGESAAESGIEETGRKNLSGLKAERCRVRRSTRSFRIGEISFMLPRWSGVESEVGFPRR